MKQMPLPRSLRREVRRSHRCPCGGKVVYKTFKRAIKAADRLGAFNEERYFAYDCPNCDGFHVTRQAQRTGVAA